MSQSRIPSFYKFSVANRLRVLLERNVIDQAEYDMLIDGTHVLDADQADRLIENVISVFGLPMGLGLNFQVNDRDYLVPMVVEEPSIIAAVSSAAKLVRSTGGFNSTAERPLLIGQIQVVNVPHAAHARQALLQHSEEILNLANSLHPNMVARGVESGEMGVACGRRAGSIADFFREGFGRFEPRGLLRGSENEDARRAQRIGDTRDKRRFGSDDHEIDGVVACKLRHG